MRDGAPHTVLVAGSSLLGVRHAFCPSPASAPAWHCVYTPGSQPGSTHMDNPGRVKGRVDRRAPPSGAGPCMRTGALRVPLPAAACPHTGDRMQTEASAAAPPPPPPSRAGCCAGGWRWARPGRGGRARGWAFRLDWHVWPVRAGGRVCSREPMVSSISCCWAQRGLQGGGWRTDCKPARGNRPGFPPAQRATPPGRKSPGLQRSAFLTLGAMK